MGSRRHGLVVGSLFAAGLVLAACGAAGVAPTGAATPVPPVGRVGAPVVAGGVSVTVHGVERRATLPNGGAGYRARDGYVYVVLDVEVGAPARAALPYSGGYVTLRDPTGFEYKETAYGFLLERKLGYGNLVQGERARGLIPFELPLAVADAGGVVAIYGGVYGIDGRPLPLRVRFDLPV